MIALEMQLIVELFVAQPYHQYLGFKVVECHGGFCQLKIEAHSKILNLMGTVHGGVIYSLCAVASSLAALSTLDSSQYTVASDFNISVLRAVSSGTLSIEARVLKSGAKLVFVQTEVCNEQGKLIASGRVTKCILPLRDKGDMFMSMNLENIIK